MTRIALVGCGGIAEGHHLPTIARSDDLVLHSACDLDIARAEAAVRKYGGARSTADWREAVADEDADLLLLCTHTNLRLDPIRAAIERGLPVYTEKPVADNLPEMVEIIRLSDESGVPVCVGYNRRSSPAFDFLRDLVAKARREGAVPGYFQRSGEERTPIPEETRTEILIRVNDDARSWKAWAFDDPDGQFYNCAGHMLDVALQLIPHPPVKVFAHGSHLGNFTQIVVFEDGSRATLHFTVAGNFASPKELYEVTTHNVFIACNNFLEVQQVGLADIPPLTQFALDYGADLTEKLGVEGYKEALARFTLPEFDRSSVFYSYIWPDKGTRMHLERFSAHTRGEGPNPFPVADALALTQVLDALVTSRLREELVAMPGHSTTEKGA